jgi:GntR family transcriptional regulator
MSEPMQRMGSSLSHQLYLLLRDDILRGRLAPESQLPSEKILAGQHGVSRITLRTALERLEAESLIRRVHGRGTFIAPQARPSILVGKLEGFVEQSEWLTRNTEVELLQLETVVPPGDVSAAMELATGEEAQRSLRRRRYRGKPCLLLETFVPSWLATLYPPAKLETGSLQDALREVGIELSRVDYTVSAAPADPRLAELLEVPVATALIAMIWAFIDRQGRMVEYQYAHARPDVYVLQTSLRPPL